MCQRPVAGTSPAEVIGYKGRVSTPPLRELAAWQELERHHAEVRDLHLRDLFASDPDRGTRLTAEGARLFLDFSKHRVTDDTLRLLLRLAEERDLRGRIDA